MSTEEQKVANNWNWSGWCFLRILHLVNVTCLNRELAPISCGPKVSIKYRPCNPVWFLGAEIKCFQSSGLTNFHFLSSEKFSSKLFFPLLYRHVPCDTMAYSFWLLRDLHSWSVLLYAQLLLWKGMCACAFLRKLSLLLIQQMHRKQLKVNDCSVVLYFSLFITFLNT